MTNESTTTINPAADLMAALAKAQGEFKAIEKNREVTIQTKTGGSYKFRYADLEEILTKTRPALASNGISLIQTIEHGQSGPLLSCKLMHANGGMITSEVMMPSARDISDPKAFGAAITYFRRYMVTAMLGVAADDDLDEDGQEIQQTQGRTAGKPQVAQPQRRQAEAPAHQATPASGDMTPCTQGELAYLTKKLEAKGMTKAQAFDAAGITHKEGDVLTKAEFTALKAVLA